MGLGGERELGHQQQTPADVAQAQIHPAVAIVEHSKPKHAHEEALHVRLDVRWPDADQGQ
jgi:hypothetical protein